MTRSRFPAFRSLRDLARNRSGATVVLFATVLAPALLGLAGVTVDVARVMAAKRAFEAGTQSAALAGAYALLAPGANATTVGAAISSWNTANPVANVTITGSTPTLACVTSTTNLPSCSGTNPNVVSVTQTGSVSTFLLDAFGRSGFTLTSTAKAAKAGGTAQPLNVMFVVDATGSMGDADTGCTGTGIRNPTRWQCALFGVQSVLQAMPTSASKVGLMIFPGLASQYSPTSHPCPTQPNSVKYYTSTVKYQIGTTLDNTYNNGSGALVNTSPIVQAVGNGTALTGCVTNKGGQGSYAAEVIAKAQAALPTDDGRQNVIIFLSDGEFNASSSNFASGNSSKTTNQCKQAVTAAQTATTDGVTVYSVAYGAATSNSGSSGCSTDSGYSPVYTPCTTLQAIASDSTKFYTTNANCKLNGSANPPTQLPAIFAAITANLATLTKPRLIPN